MPKRFPESSVAWLDATKYVKIRAGTTHRFVHVWIVVVDGRVFARSWNNKPDGWYAAFLAEGKGALEIDGKSVPVHARRVTMDSVLDAVTKAYGAKYTTKPNQKYVTGFAEKGRRPNTIELVPG